MRKCEIIIVLNFMKRIWSILRGKTRKMTKKKWTKLFTTYDSLLTDTIEMIVNIPSGQTMELLSQLNQTLCKFEPKIFRFFSLFRYMCVYRLKIDEKFYFIFCFIFWWKVAELVEFRVYSLERLGLEWRVSKDDSRQNIKVYFLSGAFISTGHFPFLVILTHHFMCTTYSFIGIAMTTGISLALSLSVNAVFHSRWDGEGTTNTHTHTVRVRVTRKRGNWWKWYIMSMFICKFHVKCAMLRCFAFCPSSFFRCSQLRTGHSTAAWESLCYRISYGIGCCKHFTPSVYTLNIETHHVRLFNPSESIWNGIFGKIIFFDFSWTASAWIRRLSSLGSWNRSPFILFDNEYNQAIPIRYLYTCTNEWRKNNNMTQWMHSRRLPLASGLIIS